MIAGKTTGVPFEPSPEEIAERAREVREQGFPSRGGKGQRVFNPPWREVDYYVRAGLPRDRSVEAMQYHSSYPNHYVEWEPSK